MEASSINELLQTSEEWSKSTYYVGLTILDHDGWDRHGDFDYSFYKEKITRREFERRLIESTVQWSLPRL